jgi:hypothetical protein
MNCTAVVAPVLAGGRPHLIAFHSRRDAATASRWQAGYDLYSRFCLRTFHQCLLVDALTFRLSIPSQISLSELAWNLFCAWVLLAVNGYLPAG